MGCLPSKSQRAIVTSTSSKSPKNLNELKDSLTFQICRLHNLTLNCRSSVEKLLHCDNKERAFIVKHKEILIKDKLEALRHSLKNIDEYEHQGLKDKNSKNALFGECTDLLKLINSAEFVDDINEIANLTSNYWVSVKKDLDKYEMSQDHIRVLLEQEYQKLKSANEGNSKRRRYSKKHNTAF